MARYIDADELSEEISSLKIFVSGDNVFYDESKAEFTKCIVIYVG